MTHLQCVNCQKHFPLFELRFECDCEGLLEVIHEAEGLRDLPQLAEKRLTSRIPADRSGVWRFREAVVPLEEKEIVTQLEGRTGFHAVESLQKWTGSPGLFIKHEGENPTGSFKDRGMTAAVSVAKRLGMPLLACASTGNTSSALSSYAARAGLKSVVFLPSGKVSLGKMAQTLGYGAHVLAVKGDFDDAMQIVRDLAKAGEVYMVNSLNPFRIEGQKTIIWDILQDMNWQAPDWIVVPGGNLGNTSAFGKAIEEAFEWGWIDKKPRLATIQAAGANPFYKSFLNGFSSLQSIQAETIATAIRIGNPVNFSRASRAIINTRGIVGQVSDKEILAAKAVIDRSGLGCEPASAATLAGLKLMVQAGLVKKEDKVVAVLTGSMLKDTDAIMKSQNLTVEEVEADAKAIKLSLDSLRSKH
ncbi:MAG: threonine synthase [Proteobacteria bacterium]|nr:MAG: threonine synthase [Pseudomonadota bacterium]